MFPSDDDSSGAGSFPGRRAFRRFTQHGQAPKRYPLPHPPHPVADMEDASPPTLLVYSEGETSVVEEDWQHEGAAPLPGMVLPTRDRPTTPKSPMTQSIQGHCSSVSPEAVPSSNVEESRSALPHSVDSQVAVVSTTVSPFLDDPLTESFGEILKKKEIYQAFGFSWGLALLLLPSSVVLMLVLRSCRSPELFMVMNLTCQNVFLVCGFSVLSLLVEAGVYRTWFEYFRYRFVPTLVATIIVSTVSGGAVLTLQPNWASAGLDFVLMIVVMFMVNAVLMFMEVFALQGSPVFLERRRLRGKDPPTLKYKLRKAPKLVMKQVCVLVVAALFLLLIFATQKWMEGASPTERGVIVTVVSATKVVIDLSLRTALIYLLPTLPVKSTESLMFCCDACLLWGMRSIVTTSQSVSFAAMSGALLSIAEITVILTYLTRSLSRRKRMLKEADLSLSDRELTVEITNFHSDVTLEV